MSALLDKLAAMKDKRPVPQVFEKEATIMGYNILTARVGSNADMEDIEGGNSGDTYFELEDAGGNVLNLGFTLKKEAYDDVPEGIISDVEADKIRISVSGTSGCITLAKSLEWIATQLRDYIDETHYGIGVRGQDEMGTVPGAIK